MLGTPSLFLVCDGKGGAQDQLTTASTDTDARCCLGPRPGDATMREVEASDWPGCGGVAEMYAAQVAGSLPRAPDGSALPTGPRSRWTAVELQDGCL